MPTAPALTCAKSRSTPHGRETLALLDQVVDTVESFEPSVVRPSLYTYLVSQRIHQDGYRVALCGEGADELFAGYAPLEHTFAQGNALGRNVQEQCLSMMHRANLQRVDRCSMRFELEIREPFLDLALVEHAARLDTTALLRTVDGLPRGKEPLREIYDLYPRRTAHANPRPPQDPVRRRRRHRVGKRGLAGLFEEAVSDADFADGKREFAAFEIATKEELYYMRRLSATMDVSRLPHLHGRIRLYVPQETAAMPEVMKRLAPRPDALFRRDVVALVELRPHALVAVPRAAGGALGIFGGALLEEVGVLDAVEDFHQPGQRMGLELLVAALGLLEIAEHRRQLELGQAPVGDVADIGLDVARASCPGPRPG